MRRNSIGVRTRVEKSDNLQLARQPCLVGTNTTFTTTTATRPQHEARINTMLRQLASSSTARVAGGIRSVSAASAAAHRLSRLPAFQLETAAAAGLARDYADQAMLRAWKAQGARIQSASARNAVPQHLTKTLEELVAHNTNDAPSHRLVLQQRGARPAAETETARSSQATRLAASLAASVSETQGATVDEIMSKTSDIGAHFLDASELRIPTTFGRPLQANAARSTSVPVHMTLTLDELLSRENLGETHRIAAQPDAMPIASPEVLRAASVFARMEAEASAAQHQPAGF